MSVELNNESGQQVDENGKVAINSPETAAAIAARLPR